MKQSSAVDSDLQAEAASATLTTPMDSPIPSTFHFWLDGTGSTDFRSDDEQRFLERLRRCSEASRWNGDAWHLFSDRTIVTVCIGSPVTVTLRADFFGDRVVVGFDTTHQLVEDLPDTDPRTSTFRSGTIEDMADFAGRFFVDQSGALR